LRKRLLKEGSNLEGKKTRGMSLHGGARGGSRWSRRGRETEGVEERVKLLSLRIRDATGIGGLRIGTCGTRDGRREGTRWTTPRKRCSAAGV